MTRQHHEYQSVETTPAVDVAPPEQVSEQSILQQGFPQDDAVAQLITEGSQPSRPALEDPKLPWRPKYLRRFVIGAFLAIFMLVFITIEILLAISNQNYGIGPGSDGSQKYLWTYGPTAVLTIIAAVWGRVEYQSKLIAPWVRLAKSPANDEKRDPKHTALLLDYVTTYQHWAIFKGLRNNDFSVSITSAVAILIKVMIIVSTGLITLSWIPVKYDSYPVVIQDQFVDDVSALNNTGTLGYYTMKGLLNTKLSFSDGLNQDYAFQSTRLLSVPLSPSTESYVMVDGFENTLDCQPADLVLLGAYPHYRRSMCHKTMNISLSSAGCDITQMTVDAPPWTEECGRNPSCNMVFARFAQGQCDGTTGNEGKRLLLLFGNLTFTPDTSFAKNISDCFTIGSSIPGRYNAELHRSTQLLCTPSYSIKNVAVTRNGSDIIAVVPSMSTSTRKLESISGWDMMDALFKSYDNTEGTLVHQHGDVIEVGGTNISRDAVMGASLPYWQQRFGPDLKGMSLYDSETLKMAAVVYYRQFGAMLAKFVLMEPALRLASTSVFISENRLVIRSWAAHWMAGLAAACILLTFVLMFTVPREGILPCGPSTVFGTASLLFHSRDLVDKLKYSAAAGPKALVGRVKGMTFKSEVVRDSYSGDPKYVVKDKSQEPSQLGFRARSFSQAATKQSHGINLHPVSRVALGLVLVGLIISLEMALRKSETENGLGDVEVDDIYIHYAWTTVPALILGLVSMVVSSIDFQIRCLAPYTHLRRTVLPKAFMDLEFLDMSVPRVMWKEFKLANFAAMAGTTAFLIASVFTIFATPLFQVDTFPVLVPLTLQANQSFDTTTDTFGSIWNAGDQPASLILASNLTYPRFTSENLAFPEYLIISGLPGDKSHASSLSINTVLPAIRPGLECRLYDASHHRVDLSRDYRDYSASGFSLLDVGFTGERCDLWAKSPEGNPTTLSFAKTASTPKDFNPDETIYFGTGSITGSINPKNCSDLRYTWGKLDYSGDKPVVSHIATLGCNITFHTVDVNVSLHVVSGSDGPVLDLDRTKPLQVLEGTARDTTFGKDYDRGMMYNNLMTFPVYRGLRLEQFFQLLTRSSMAIPVSHLGDPARTDEVIEAIKFQHVLIQTQSLDARRAPAEESNAVTGFSVNPDRATPEWGNDAEPVYDATGMVTDITRQRRRVVQDVVSTLVLEVLLGLTLGLLIISWVLLGDTRILASSPTSIAAIASLIGGGNVIQRMGGQVWVDTKGNVDDTGVVDEVKYFWLGWGPGGGDERDTTGEEPGSDGVEAGGKTKRFGIYGVTQEDEQMFKGYVTLGGGLWKGSNKSSKERGGETGVLLD